MIDGLDHADIRTMYENSIVLHKNRPVLFERISGKGTVRFLDILNQEEGEVEFSQKAFLPPTRRLGMVNHHNSVVYASRLPVRKYKVGLSRENLSVKAIPADGLYPTAEVKAAILSLTSTSLARTLFNKYPTLKKAKESVLDFGGVVAFDRQFAVDQFRQILYKSTIVGTISIDGETVEAIRFKPEFAYLKGLLTA